ncbi:hypothetical protein [Sedimentitalea nanhaiensis]|uniref:Lipoprotein n=1 Tax=Sedimentitalea nanhaiensis TaxID=999627 RepID=A0A1I7B9A4_9RHOB|nr:hypothetical protein [Sedimentitalea nanhaiensis]SFT83786.1 hypothetical protein SAMN05216236_10925 [Sedimentitalea nanhaiensis]
MRPPLTLIPTLLGVVVAACSPQDMVETTGKARFADYPDSLLDALEAACDGPAQNFVRPAPDSVECREFLPPKPTAAIILSYDGTPEHLPQLVIRFQTRPDAPGYVVQNQVFLNVPQKHGAPLHVRQDDPKLNRELAELYRRTGGIPEL